MHLLVTLIVGLVVGAIAKLVMPGRDPGGIIVTILLGIAEFSPYLFDLIRADAARLVRLLNCEPETHLPALIETSSHEVLAAAGEADVMRLLRRMKSEAALLIALTDIGGVWPVMQVTAALTEVAVASVQAALRYLLRQEAARGRLSPANLECGDENSGLFVLAMGKIDRKSVV